jgi:hypothetical protein
MKDKMTLFIIVDSNLFVLQNYSNFKESNPSKNFFWLLIRFLIIDPNQKIILLCYDIKEMSKEQLLGQLINMHI